MILVDQSRLDAPGSEDVSNPLADFVVLFLHFHEHGFTMPPHPFLVGVLHLDQNQLHHLNLNGVQHMVAFVALCEGYLGMSLHFHLWCYFFTAEFLRKRPMPDA